jgi:hypothetical protein
MDVKAMTASVATLTALAWKIAGAPVLRERPLLAGVFRQQSIDPGNIRRSRLPLAHARVLGQWIARAPA